MVGVLHVVLQMSHSAAKCALCDCFVFLLTDLQPCAMLRPDHCLAAIFPGKHGKQDVPRARLVAWCCVHFSVLHVGVLSFTGMLTNGASTMVQGTVGPASVPLFCLRLLPRVCSSREIVAHGANSIKMLAFPFNLGPRFGADLQWAGRSLREWVVLTSL